MDRSKVRWGERSRILLRAAREISKDLGHYEIICPLHLLLGMLVNARPVTLGVAEPDWDWVRAAMREFAPPWEEGLVVLSPGGQTPTTKRILECAAELAQGSGEVAEVEHVWAAINTVEPELVQAVFSRLSLAPVATIAEPGAPADGGRDTGSS